MGKAATNISNKFEVVSRTLDDVRVAILKNSSLTGIDRQIALDKVKNAELEAARSFVSSLENLIGRFDNVPEIIKGKLSQKLDELKLDIGENTSSLNAKEIAENIGRQMDATFKGFTTAKDVASGDNSRIEELQDGIEKLNIRTQKSFENTLNKLDVNSFSNEEKSTLEEIKEAFASKNVEEGNRISAVLLKKIEDSPRVFI